MINLRETLGVAVNSGSLAVQEEERAVDRVASLAFTEELGSLLWRVKYGNQQHFFELIGDASGSSAMARITLKLEQWLRRRERRWAAKGRGELFPLFVRLVLADWLSDKCGACHGRGMLGVERTRVQTIRQLCPQCSGTGYTLRTTRGGRKLQIVCKRCCGNKSISLQREREREKPRPCPACSGLGQAVLTPAMWASLLGVPLTDWMDHWDKPMLRLRDYLRAIDKRTAAQVKAQLGRE